MRNRRRQNAAKELMETMSERNERSKGDIFQLLLDTSEKQKKSTRRQLLESFKVKEYFKDGTININERTCQGLECELCIKACPTKALYWQDGRVAIIRDLCVYCGACVLCCIVDDCIRITRKRFDGRTESFSKPQEVVSLCNSINAEKRHDRLKALFPDAEAYLKRYRKL
jgi:Fe-S-cluster-containing hydrogenase component 2